MLSPGKYYVDTTLRLNVAFTDQNGAAIDPSTVTFETMSPRNLRSTYVYGTSSQIGKASTGNYYADIVPDEPGRWQFRWVTTGTGTAIVQEGDFIIQDSVFWSGNFPDYCLW